MKTMRNVMLVSALVALPSLTTAQVVGGATGAVTGAAQINKAPAMPPPPPPPPPPTAAAQVSGSASAATAVRAPVASPAAANSAAGTQASAGIPSSKGVNASASSHASATGQARGLSIASTAGQNATVALNTTATVGEISHTAFAARRELASRVEARLEASEKSVAALRARADAAGDRTRREFGRAMNEIREREKALRVSLKATTKAAGESTWGEVQSTLAKDYRAYAEAVASAEAVAEGSASAGEAPKP